MQLKKQESMSYDIICFAIPIITLIIWGVKIHENKESVRMHHLAAWSIIFFGMAIMLFAIQYHPFFRYSFWRMNFFAIILSLFIPAHFFFFADFAKQHGLETKLLIAIIPLLLNSIIFPAIGILLDEEEEKLYIQAFNLEIDEHDYPRIRQYIIFSKALLHFTSCAIIVMLGWTVYRIRKYMGYLEEHFSDAASKTGTDLFAASAFYIILISTMLYIVYAPYKYHLNTIVNAVLAILLTVTTHFYGLYIQRIKARASDIKREELRHSSELQEMENFETVTGMTINDVYGKASRETKKANSKVIMEKIKSEKIYLEKDVTLSDLAKRLEISQGDLSRSFHYYYQASMSSVFTKFRIEHAIEIIHSKNAEISYGDLAKACGYDDIRLFCDDFKKETRISLKDYLGK